MLIIVAVAPCLVLQKRGLEPHMKQFKIKVRISWIERAYERKYDSKKWLIGFDTIESDDMQYLPYEAKTGRNTKLWLDDSYENTKRVFVAHMTQSGNLIIDDEIKEAQNI